MTALYIEVVVDGRRIFQHRAVMEEKLGRRLSSDEIVHHINGDGHDNSIANLQLVSRKEHAVEHMRDTTKEILRLNAVGLDNREIAKMVNISVINVWKVLDCRNLKAKHRPPVPLKWDLQKAMEMFKSGMSLRHIGRTLGVSHTALGVKFRSINLSR